MIFFEAGVAAEEQVLRLQNHLELTQRIARIASWEWDIATGTNIWSDYFFTICGLDIGSVRPSQEAFFEILHPDDHARVKQSVALTLEGRAPYDIEIRLLRPDGSTVYVRSSGQIERDAGGKPFRMTGTLVDITDAKRREVELLAVSESMKIAQDFGNMGSYSWDIEADEAFWSPEFWRLHEINPRSSKPNFQTWAESVHPEDRTAANATIANAIRNKTPIRHEYRVNKSGEPRWLICKGDFILGADGNPQRIVGMVTDSSYTKQERLLLADESDRLEALVLERTRELAAARDAAEQASKTKDIILSNMSHELRTPMNHILGFNSILKKEITSKQGLERMDKVMASANRLLRLINNLLDTALLETQQMQVEGRDFTMNALVQELRKRFADQVQRKGLQLHFHVNMDADQWLHGDFTHLLQVLDELVDNAIKFSAIGNIEIHASMESIGARLVDLRLEVHDQGAGIPVDQQANMFHLFVQQDGSSSRRYGGMGLGLGLCQRIVNLMAGEIGLDSEPGKGTRVWIKVPLAPTNAPDVTDASEVQTWDQALEAMQQLFDLLVVGDFKAVVVWEGNKQKFSAMLGHDAEAFAQSMAAFELDLAAGILKRVIDCNRPRQVPAIA